MALVLAKTNLASGGPEDDEDDGGNNSGGCQPHLPCCMNLTFTWACDGPETAAGEDGGSAVGTSVGVVLLVVVVVVATGLEIAKLCPDRPKMEDLHNPLFAAHNPPSSIIGKERFYFNGLIHLGIDQS